MRRLRVDKAHPSNLESDILRAGEAQYGPFVHDWALVTVQSSEPLTEDCGASEDRLLELDRLILLDDGCLTRCRCMSSQDDPVYLDEKPILDAPLRLLLACLVALVWLTVLILSV